MSASALSREIQSGEENTMFQKKLVRALTKIEISMLHGGPKHNFRYFVGISETAESDVFTNIVYAKLRNQMGSQRSGGFPDGYEPFVICETRKFCLRTM